jgi:hypothetical protein
MSSPSPIAPVSYVVRLVTETDGPVLVGPFTSEAEAAAWLNGMPDDEDMIDADVVAMAGPVRADGEPNY